MGFSAQSDLELIDALRGGDEGAFIELVDRFHGSMLRLSRSLVSSHSIAEEVVQEAWVGVLLGLGRFEGRASLKTWIFRIVTNIGLRKAERERRSIPFSTVDANGGPAVDPDRFRRGSDRWRGHWVSPPRDWSSIPEEKMLARETADHVAAAIANLPSNLRAVITLRDVEGVSSEEACDILSISQANQRVLLHRARSRVRAALEQYIESR